MIYRIILDNMFFEYIRGNGVYKTPNIDFAYVFYSLSRARIYMQDLQRSLGYKLTPKIVVYDSL